MKPLDNEHDNLIYINNVNIHLKRLMNINYDEKNR